MVTIAAGQLGAGQRAGSPSTSSPEGQCHVFTFLSSDLTFTIHPWTKCDKSIVQVQGFLNMCQVSIIRLGGVKPVQCL